MPVLPTVEVFNVNNSDAIISYQATNYLAPGTYLAPNSIIRPRMIGGRDRALVGGGARAAAPPST